MAQGNLTLPGLTLRGQSESLTGRICGLLSEYSDGLAVPKELLQNADDAGASEVTLVLDTRQNAGCRHRLLDPRLADWQGPCLWAHNDAAFSDRDFANLCRLGGATKRERAEDGQVGKFGLGFNAVYNLTDVPSVLSGYKLQILDPHGDVVHGGYLESLYQSMGQRQTGAMLDFSADNWALLSKYADQLEPFLGTLGCNLGPDRPFSGTLIRLPLRTPALAAASRISPRPYSVDDAWSLMRQLAEQAANLLLFAQSVRRLTLAHRADGDTSCRVLLVAERSLEVCHTGHGLPVPGVSDPLSVQCSLLKAAQSLMKQRQRREAPVLCSFTMRVRVSPSSGSHRLAASASDRRWLVSSAIGGSEASEMALEHPSLALSPVGSVAVRLSGSGGRSVPDPLPAAESTAFCFLPLPAGADAPPFPVLLNGAFALTSSRRHLLEATGDDKRGEWNLGHWNARLMSGVLCPAYLRALELLAELGTPAESALRMWPQGKIGRLWEPLVRELYLSVFAAGGPAVLPSGGGDDNDGWCSYESCEFIDPGLLALTTIARPMRVLLDGVGGGRSGFVWLGERVHAAAAKFAGPELLQRLVTIEECALRVLDAAPRLWNNGTMRSQFKTVLVFLLRSLGRSTFAFDTSASIATPAVRERMKSGSPCIPDRRKVLRAPRELLDPKCHAAGLYDLETDSVMFPCKDLCADGELLKALLGLGLRSEISTEEVAERAHSIAGLPERAAREQRMCKLLIYVRDMTNKSQRLSVTNQLRSIAFLSVKERPSDFPLPWHSSATNLMRPPELFREHLANLVCLSHPVMDERFLGNSNLDNLLNEIGVSSTVSNELALKQLMLLSQSKQTLQARGVCSAVSEAVYAHLSGTSVASKILSDMIAKQSNRQLVYHPTGGFLLPEQASLSSTDAGLPPHLFCIRHLSRSDASKRFLTSIGVVEQFCAGSYVQALRRLRDKSGGSAVSQGDLRCCAELLGRLLTSDGSEQLPPASEIFAPDRSGIMRPCSELCYNNLPWMDNLQPAPGLHFTNKCLSFDTCERLRVPTQRDQTMRGICEPFGQHENLTTRLAGILNGYPLGFELFNEFIQNADDAGATEVAFVNDKRRLDTCQVLSDSWAELQGPALLAFNDAVFTDADLKGIQSLGVGSKKSEAWKTGRFGIGFNSVYNVTDVPHFISNGDTMCVLDPHCAYAPLASAWGSLGARFSLTPDHKKMFKDAFEGFLPGHLKQVGCTVFRLPLRTPKQAAASEICSQSVDSQKIAELFAEFRSQIGLTLLFLTNVRRVKLLEVLPDCSVKNVCTVSAKTSMSNLELAAFNTLCRTTGDALRAQRANLASQVCSSVAYVLDTKEENEGSGGNVEKWIVVQCVNLPPSRNVQVPKDLAHKVASGGWSILPKVGVAALLSGGPEFALKSAASRKCRVFSLLPLPVSTDLPVHVNGCFALDPSRRALWSGHSVDAETQWNKLLMCGMLPHCYATIMRALTQQTGISIDRYCELLPALHGDSSVWNELGEELYRELLTGRWAVFPCQSGDSASWLPLATSDECVDGRACFLEDFGSIEHIRPVLQRLGIPLIVKQLSHLRIMIGRIGGSYTPTFSPVVAAKFLRGPLCANLQDELPMAVEKTPMRDAESVVDLMAFILGRPSEVSEGAKRMQELQLTPLNLTADGMLNTLQLEKLPP